jgi:hypothetical protein
MAIVATILILMQYRRDQKLKSRISRSFFNSAPVAVQKIKGFKPNRKSALGKPRTYPTDLEAGDVVRRPLQSDPSPMRARSASLDSISGMPRADHIGRGIEGRAVGRIAYRSGFIDRCIKLIIHVLPNDCLCATSAPH